MSRFVTSNRWTAVKVDVQVNWVLKDVAKQEEKSGDPSATTDRKDVCIIFLAHVQEP